MLASAVLFSSFSSGHDAASWQRRGLRQTAAFRLGHRSTGFSPPSRFAAFLPHAERQTKDPQIAASLRDDLESFEAGPRGAGLD